MARPSPEERRTLNAHQTIALPSNTHTHTLFHKCLFFGSCWCTLFCFPYVLYNTAFTTATDLFKKLLHIIYIFLVPILLVLASICISLYITVFFNCLHTKPLYFTQFLKPDTQTSQLHIKSAKPYTNSQL